MPNSYRVTQPLRGLRQIADRYDGFILDQWGVLHNGREAYPGAVDCLLKLKALGKHTVILSNSGKRANANEARLAALGFEPSSYGQIVTSGDVAWKALKTRSDPQYRRLGRRCFLISNDSDQSIVKDLQIDLAHDVESADFILLAGFGDLEQQSDYDALLRSAFNRRLPMLCANPDLTRFLKGSIVPGSGSIALSYEQLGGEVHYVGKPHPKVYEYCWACFAERSVRRIVAIGDSLQHDIAGGNAVGLDTAFICGGIHRDHFASAETTRTKQRLLAELVGDHDDRRPTWMLPTIRW